VTYGPSMNHTARSPRRLLLRLIFIVLVAVWAVWRIFNHNGILGLVGGLLVLIGAIVGAWGTTITYRKS
jgi:thiol:disulfide interchange protein